MPCTLCNHWKNIVSYVSPFYDCIIRLQPINLYSTKTSFISLYIWRRKKQLKILWRYAANTPCIPADSLLLFAVQYTEIGVQLNNCNWHINFSRKNYSFYLFQNSQIPCGNELLLLLLHLRHRFDSNIQHNNSHVFKIYSSNQIWMELLVLNSNGYHLRFSSRKCECRI